MTNQNPTSIQNIAARPRRYDHGLEPVLNELLSEYPAILEIPIAWGDMDAFGHVNNTIYIRHFESVRIVYLQLIGQQEYMRADGVGPILASVSCRYRLPVTFPDTVIAAARVTSIGEDRFTMQHRTVSRRHGRIAAEGECIIVTYDYDKMRKAPLPADMRASIAALEGFAP